VALTIGPTDEEEEEKSESNKKKSQHTIQHAKFLSLYACTSEQQEQHFITSCLIYEFQFPNKELPRETQPSCNA
jgi:hypothetical protein